MKTAERYAAPALPEERSDVEGTVVTWEQIEAYLNSLPVRGRVEDTVKAYRRTLTRFYRDLPQDKRVDEKTLSRWKDLLLDQGYTARTINFSISSANSLLDYLGLRGYQQPQYLKLPKDEEQPELTRSEYLRLLSTARILDKRRVYLLVKVFALTGLTVGDLPQLTVQAVRDGCLPQEQEPTRPLFLPGCLREELLEYIHQEGILSGPVFVTRNRKPMCRTAVTACIQALAGDAQVLPEKCNPRCLHKLYLETRRQLRRTFLPLMEQAFEQLLETEQLAVGWENEESG